MTDSPDTGRLPSFLERRRAGILLHPTSLPGPRERGDLGADAHRFVEFLADAGFSVWQTLPVGPTHVEHSPYHGLSAHAGDPGLISPDLLAEAGLVDAHVPPGLEPELWLGEAWHRFTERAEEAERRDFEAFVARYGYWLEDYVLYRALRRQMGDAPWRKWPPPFRDREPPALDRARAQLADALALYRFEQFLFFRQWTALKRHANERGILLFGDMPIFVALDSVEVWAHREYFALDPEGRPETVAGVPPDYFSETGQRWGNPHYRWDRLQADGFRWWVERLRTQLTLFDLVRIDHFRGLQAYWEIPAAARTAREGRWVEAPGDALLRTLREHFPDLPLVAEDLGVITPEVEALRRRHGLPGMKILQFAFDGGADNPYLPHNHSPDCVVYTGTHDNDTTLGWFETLPEGIREYVLDYLGRPREPMPWPLVRTALASVARLSVVPMQDVLGLGAEARMNTPGRTGGNWRWRFRWEDVPPDLTGRVHRLLGLYGRI